MSSDDSNEDEPSDASNRGEESGASGPTVTARGTAGGSRIWLAVMVITGIGLIVIGLFASQDDNSAVATAVAGGILMLLAVVVLSGFKGTRAIAGIGFVLGLLLIVSGLITDDIDLPEVSRIVAGGIVAMSSAGALAALSSGRASEDKSAT